jgi:hypothetical protein
MTRTWGGWTAPPGLPALALALLGSTACATTTAPRPGSCPAHTFRSSAGTCVPEAWYCSPALYNAGPEDGCDCNCGAPDPDCRPGATSYWCYNLGMARRVPRCAACAGAPGAPSGQRPDVQP